MARFWPKVRIAGADECWEWIAAKDRDGYGAFNPADGSGRKVTRAHRFLVERQQGGVPSDLVVMHTCDNRACVNPRHLRLGTHADNIRDRDQKGRTPLGESRYNARLTEAAVRDIRRAPRDRKSLSPLAAKYGVSYSVVASVAYGRTWAHVP